MTFYEGDAGLRRIADAYDRRLVPWLFAHWVDRLVGLARPDPSARVIDLACGTGAVTRSVLERLEGSGRIHSVDLDAAMLGYAAAAIDDRRVSWHEADASQLPIEASSIDAVICNQGLQFFPDRAAVLGELARVLRPDGRVAFAVWGRLEDNPWPAAMAAAMGDFLGDEARRGTETVCGLGDPDGVRSLLENAGFGDVVVAEVELTATHPDLHDAIDGQLASVPSAESIEALGPHRRSQLIDTMANHLARFTSPTGALSVPSTSVLATATAPV